MASPDELMRLAERARVAQSKLDLLIDNPKNLSPDMQALAIGLLMTLNAKLFGECAFALKALSSRGGEDV